MTNTRKQNVSQAILCSKMNEMLKRQACQIEIMKTKNEQLVLLVKYLQKIILEYDPSMKQQLDALKYITRN